MHSEVRQMLASLAGGHRQEGLCHIVVHLREDSHIVAGRAVAGGACPENTYKIRGKSYKRYADDNKRGSGAYVALGERYILAFNKIGYNGYDRKREQYEYERGICARIGVVRRISDRSDRVQRKGCRERNGDGLFPQITVHEIDGGAEYQRYRQTRNQTNSACKFRNACEIFLMDQRDRKQRQKPTAESRQAKSGCYWLYARYYFFKGFFFHLYLLL